MFVVGQHVIHPGQGVCTVMGVRDDEPSPMLVLHAKSGRAETHMLYPVSQQNRLHTIISRSEAEELLDNYSEIEVDPFTERNSSLEESHFKQLLKQGAPETVRVAKTMRSRIANAEDHGKKPSSYYSRILKEAHQRAVEELSVAIGCSEDDLELRIEQALSAPAAPSLN